MSLERKYIARNYNNNWFDRIESSLSLLGDLIPTFWKCSNVHNLDDSPSISLLWDVSQFWGSVASGTQ